jgi:signal transduction histidine kinase
MEPALAILVLASIGQDSRLLVRNLTAGGVAAEAVPDHRALIARLTREMPDGPGMLIIAEEALQPALMQALVAQVSLQPPWSDIPIIVITSAGAVDSPERLQTLHAFGPTGAVTMLERPFKVLTLTTMVQVALRARRRQFQVRDLLVIQERDAQQIAEKAAELARTNDELEKFAAVASHDLQEPLRMITSYIDLIGRRYGEKFDARAGEYFAHVADGAQRMRALINSILEYSRLGQDGVSFEKTDSGAAVADAMQQLAPRISETAGVITTAALPCVRSNRLLLGQVFMNLIGNALTFCESRPTIRIGAQDEGRNWLFTVADNGIGMPRELQDKLFKIFRRLHAAGKYRGTGIGLATCKKIVDLHGGRIWAESTVGAGSTFFIALPK